MHSIKNGFYLGCVSCLLLLLSMADSVNAADLKVYISADMEGIAGAVNYDQIDSESADYQQFRSYMTAEVNAAIEAAREAGAKKIVVSDSHGNGHNLLLDELPQDIELVGGWPRTLGMMEGIDESFSAAIFIGYHASAGNLKGISAHTISGSNFSSVKINGKEITEGGINALIAGHFGVPVVMMSGDDAAVSEVSAMVGNLEGAVVKWSISHTSGRTLLPKAAQSLIKEKAKAGLSRRNEIMPFRIEGPLALDITFKNDEASELLAYLANVERVDNRTIRYVGNIVEISKFIEFVTGYPETMK